MTSGRPRAERRSGDDRRGDAERRDSTRSVTRVPGRHDRRTGQERRTGNRRRSGTSGAGRDRERPR
jgi:hypothetical protein